MKINYLAFLIIGATPVASLDCAVASPTKAPKNPAHTRAQYAPVGSLLHYYDLIPSKHFAGFGNGTRRSLLQRKGAIVDYKRKFIQIPGHPNGNRDIQMLQMSLLTNGKEPWVAVSRIVRSNQSRTPSMLNFYYGYNDAGGLREAVSDFFPYTLRRRGRSEFENAYLPRKGLTIEIGTASTRNRGPKFAYTPRAGADGSFFVRTS